MMGPHLFWQWLAMTLQLTLGVGPTSPGEGPHCSSVFHVWHPDRGAQQILQEIQLRLDNLTWFTAAQIAEVKTYVTLEASRLQNWTLVVDKKMLQMQIDQMDEELIHVKFSAGSSKLRSLLDLVSRRVENLEKSARSSASKVGCGGNTAQEMEHIDHLPQQQGLGSELAAVLKNSIGDLKAEWILLKRDIESLKKESLFCQEGHQEMQNNTAEMKLHLDKLAKKATEQDIKLDVMANKQHKQDIQNQQVIAGWQDLMLSLDQYKAQILQHEKNVASLQNVLSLLQKQLNHVIQHTTKVKDIVISRGKQDNPPSEPETGLSPLDQQLQNHILQVPDKYTERVGLKDNVLDFSGNDSQVDDFSLHPEESVSLMKDETHHAPQDCQDLYQAGFQVSSVYQVQPAGARYSWPVYCDMINNTGYTLIQRRIDGTLNFNRRWSEYQHGFGNPYGEFWAGNELIHLLTMQKPYVLRLDLWDWEGGQFYAEYSRFYVEGASDNFRLTVGEYSGNAGDSLGYHNKMFFSTEDMDNDLHQRHCAAENKAGWWYHSCYYSQLNGVYHTAWYARSQSAYADGIVWFTLKDTEFYSLKKVEMKLKPLKSVG